MKRRRLPLLVLTALFPIMAAVQPAAADESRLPVELRWAFVVKTGTEAAAYVPITRDTALKTGDRFRLYVQREAGCYLYLVYQSSQNDFHLLFPADPARYDSGLNRAEAA